MRSIQSQSKVIYTEPTDVDTTSCTASIHHFRFGEFVLIRICVSVRHPAAGIQIYTPDLIAAGVGDSGVPIIRDWLGDAGRH